MSGALKQAIKQLASLPAQAQEKIGGELLLHIDKLHRLRTQLEHAANALDRNDGRALHIEEVIKRARARYGEA